MSSKFRFWLAVASVWLCGPGGLAAEPTPPGSPAAPPAPTHSANYELSPGDNISITVYREADLSIQQRLSRDGTINFPLLGVVKLAGKNTNDAAAHIAELLGKGYLIHPQVSVAIVEVAKLKFTVLGQVSNPGAFEIPGDQNIDILAAIARAGGFTRIANQSSVVVRRTANGREETYKVDVKKLMTDRQSPRFQLQSNDTISVPERIF